MNGKLKGKVEAAKDASQDEVVSKAKEIDAVKQYLTGEPKKVVYVPGRLLNFVIYPPGLHMHLKQAYAKNTLVFVPCGLLNTAAPESNQTRKSISELSIAIFCLKNKRSTFPA